MFAVNAAAQRLAQGRSSGRRCSGRWKPCPQPALATLISILDGGGGCRSRGDSVSVSPGSFGLCSGCRRDT